MKQADIKSKRIEALQTEIKKGNRDSIEKFYKELKMNGHPIIEPIDHDEEQSLVTFIYKDTHHCENVYLIGDIFGGDIYGETNVKSNMQRLLDTDLYYISYIVRNDAKSLYVFGINIPDGDEDIPDENIFLDPLNPQTFISPKDDLNPDNSFYFVDQESILVMPQAKPLDDDKRIENQGTLTQTKFTSHILNNERRVWLYQPFGFNPNQSYGLYVFTDGFEYLNLVNAKDVLDQLIDQNEIKPACALFIESTEARSTELNENEDYLNFITDELIPSIQTKIRLSTNPKDHLFIGLSRGGLFSAFVGLKQSHFFGNIICQSPAFWLNNESIVEKYQTEDKLDLNFYIEYGYYEKVHQFVIDAIDHFLLALDKKAIPYSLNVFPGAHVYNDWHDTLPKAIKYFFKNEEN